MMKKQIVSLILALVLCIPLPIAAEEHPLSEKGVFNDVKKESNAYEAISYLYDKGIINGKGNNLFCPEDSLKREEFAKMVVNAFKLSGASKKSFADAVKAEWYESYVSKVEAAGLMQGISETEFGIGHNISRQDLAVVIKRLLDNMEVKLNDGNIEPFADSETIAPYAKEAVTALCANGIMQVREDNLFLPNEKASRSEAAFVVYNAITALLDVWHHSSSITVPMMCRQMTTLHSMSRNYLIRKSFRARSLSMRISRMTITVY